MSETQQAVQHRLKTKIIFYRIKIQHKFLLSTQNQPFHTFM